MIIENLFSIQILAVYINRERERAKKRSGRRRSGGHQQLLLLLRAGTTRARPAGCCCCCSLPAMDLHTTAPCSPSPHSSVKSFVGGPRVPVREEKKKRQKRKEKTHTHTPKLKHTHTHTQIQTHIPDTHTETKERKKGTRKKGHKAKLPTTDCLTDSLRLPLYAIHSFFVVSSIAHFYCCCLLPSYQAPPLARSQSPLWILPLSSAFCFVCLLLCFLGGLANKPICFLSL